MGTADSRLCINLSPTAEKKFMGTWDRKIGKRHVLIHELELYQGQKPANVDEKQKKNKGRTILHFGSITLNTLPCICANNVNPIASAW